MHLGWQYTSDHNAKGSNTHLVHTQSHYFTPQKFPFFADLNSHAKASCLTVFVCAPYARD